METINLLPHQSRLDFERLKKEEKWRKIATFVLGGVIISSLVVIFLRLFFSWQIRKNSQRLNEVKREFAQFLPLIEQGQNIRFRVKLVADILEKRISRETQWQKIKEILGDDTSLSWVKIGGREIEIGGMIRSYSRLKEIENLLEEEKKKENYQQIEFDSLTQTKTGEWDFSLILKEKEKK